MESILFSFLSCTRCSAERCATRVYQLLLAGMSFLYSLQGKAYAGEFCIVISEVSAGSLIHRLPELRPYTLSSPIKSNCGKAVGIPSVHISHWPMTA